MRHLNEHGGKAAQVRITTDMLPRGLQRADRVTQVKVMYRLLKRAATACGLTRKLKDHEHYVKPGEKRRRKDRLAKAVARGEIKTREQELAERDQRGSDEYNY